MTKKEQISRKLYELSEMHQTISYVLRDLVYLLNSEEEGENNE